MAIGSRKAANRPSISPNTGTRCGSHRRRARGLVFLRGWCSGSPCGEPGRHRAAPPEPRHAPQPNLRPGFPRREWLSSGKAGRRHRPGPCAFRARRRPCSSGRLPRHRGHGRCGRPCNSATRRSPSASPMPAEYGRGRLLTPARRPAGPGPAPGRVRARQPGPYLIEARQIEAARFQRCDLRRVHVDAPGPVGGKVCGPPDMRTRPAIFIRTRARQPRPSRPGPRSLPPASRRKAPGG